MGSKRIRRMLFAVIFIFAAVTGVIAAVNLDTVKQKLGFSVSEQVQETAAMEDDTCVSRFFGGECN